MSLVKSTGVFIGKTVGKFLISGTVGLGISTLSATSGIAIAAIRQLVAYGWLTGEYLSKQLNAAQIKQLKNELQDLVKEGKIKQLVADVIVNELSKINSIKADIVNSSNNPPARKNGKSLLQLVREGYNSRNVK